jgi:hypothetical protein
MQSRIIAFLGTARLLLAYATTALAADDRFTTATQGFPDDPGVPSTSE